MCYNRPKRVIYLRLPNGKTPFQDWVLGLPLNIQLIIQSYIDRIARGGGKKNIRNIGDGVFEIKIKYGPGLRIYFAYQGKKIILLFLGGDKGSQKRDISLAKKYWRDYVSK
ncbi:MAG: type II toxin-antitoxin system RelE/ParE family toxin [Epsilonproteobacteria bacterium]|nr:MAG: type II toxin-antitoxin system RelE/ParE family toxin [Campylobacterota bacterium]